jgi:microcin C transport system substrate-binding protein
MYIRITCLLMYFVLLNGCSSDQNDNVTGHETAEEFVAVIHPDYPAILLPDGLVWETNNEDPVFSSPNAKKGGTFRGSLQSFPLTLRGFGPDANGTFANYVHAFQMGLIEIHPNTDNPIPVLATHWAFGSDSKTVYYKLDPDATWSDGKPVTADDFMFTLEFMRSDYIVDPYVNNFFTNEITNIQKYADDIISVSYISERPKTDLLYYTDVVPVARHFHKLDEKWVFDYNWLIEPNTGPYNITKVEKGKSIEYSRNENWWAKDKRYFEKRFNPDKYELVVLREIQTEFNHFLKGEVDTFWMPWPDYWHEKAKGQPFDDGYIHKIEFYNQSPQSIQGFVLNTDFELFKDSNVRYAFAHSINFEKVIDTLLHGDYEREKTVFSGYPGYTNTNIEPRKYDLQKADEYFTIAGWVERGPDGIRVKDGSRLSITIPYGQTNLKERFVVLIEEAKKAGLELKLQQMDRSAEFKNLLEKKHQIGYLALTTDFRPEYWSLFHSENAHISNTNNFNNIDDPVLDKLIDEYRLSTVEDDRMRLSRDIQQRIHDLAIYIPSYRVPFTRTGYWRWLKLPEHYGTRISDYLFPPVGGGLFWIDEQVKQETLEAMKSGKTFEPVTIIDETYRLQ